ncbi:MAG TPA: PKHD-type hydroxylase, partial [Rhodanobacteraceae bacterium]|nr:PKHD-type hydroxylase [Rhodanobacteraceae bacterium]
MLVHIPEVLDAERIAAMRAKLEAADWTDGRET